MTKQNLTLAHIQATYDARGYWTAKVFKTNQDSDMVLMTQARGCTQLDAVTEAVQCERRRVRIERESARY